MSEGATKAMRVLVIGTGRMGAAVAVAAEEAGHEVVALMGRREVAEAKWPAADVAIEFTLPESALSVIEGCWQRGIPVVSGTTGWEAQHSAAEARVAEGGHALLWAPNFSVGVHLFRKALRSVAQVMEDRSGFAASIHEVHHTGKQDAPSGTAKALGLDLAAQGITDVPITAQRLAGVPGTHTVEWRSEIDSIVLTHNALNRKGFAVGAVRAAEWLAQSPRPCDRIFGMKDVWG